MSHFAQKESVVGLRQNAKKYNLVCQKYGKRIDAIPKGMTLYQNYMHEIGVPKMLREKEVKL